MKKILVATDFSTCATNAMAYAMELARLLKMELCAIHAIGSNEGVNNNMYSAIYIEDYYNNKRAALSEWAKTFSSKEEYTGVTVSTVAEVGSVSAVLTKYIEQNEVELLVMGTMGSTGILGLFGSNTHSMITKTKTPTLIVPLESKFSIDPVITLAADFTKNLSSIEVNALNEMVEAFKSTKLTVLNVVEENKWKRNEDAEEKLSNMITGAKLEFSYISEESTIEGIINFIISNQTDILCLVKHHHNILYRLLTRSTVNQVINNKAIKAILILHD